METAEREEAKAESEAKARAEAEAELEDKRVQEQKDIKLAMELEERINNDKRREDAAALEPEQASNPLLLPR